MQLRWATWNLWAVGPAWAARSAAAATILAEVGADLLCLQEARRDATGDVAAALADELGLHLIRGEPCGAEWWSGRTGVAMAVDNVVLSRWPAAEISLQALPGVAGSPERRTALHVRVETPEACLRVVSTQLTSSPLDSRRRVAQVTALAAHLARERRADEAVLVAGDMNAEPDSDEMRLLCGHKTAPPVEGHVLMDLWRFAEPGSRDATWDRANPHVAASREPSARIDVLLAAPIPRGVLPEVGSIDRFATGPVDGVWASDHAGVVADLLIA